MKTKKISKKILICIFLSALFCIGLIFGLLPLSNLNFYNSSNQDVSFGWRFPVAKFPLTGADSNLIAYSSIRDPGGIPQGLPVRLQIPTIGVDTAIEDALITSDGRMDVPIGSVNVAWFSLGPHPGQVGSAVIGGHFGIDNGIPFVFYDLDKLKAGDKVYIIDDEDNTLAFVVRSISSYDRNADATTVFTSQDGIAHLNLITCEGVWNQVNGSYPLRLVVFTDAIPSEGAVSVKPRLPATALVTQSQLPLATPTPISSFVVSKESTPSSNAVKTSPIYIVSLLQVINILYASPLDGVITTALMLGILFVLIKIIRR